MKQIDINLYYFATYRKGSTPWYEAQFNELGRHGVIAIYYDSKMYLYKGLSRKDIRGIKVGIRTAWQKELSTGACLTGLYPNYSIT